MERAPLLAESQKSAQALPIFSRLKSRPGGRRFLQIDRASKAKSGPKLDRVAFRVSRLMEFCSERELVNQTGHFAPRLDASLANDAP